MTTILCIADRLQTGQEIELWREPQPGSLLTIACDSRCVILSSAWHSPRRCVITSDCHNLVSKSRRGLWPGLRCCQLWAFLKQSTYSVCGCRALALRWLWVPCDSFCWFASSPSAVKSRSFWRSGTQRTFHVYVVFVIWGYFWSAHSYGSKRRWDR